MNVHARANQGYAPALSKNSSVDTEIGIIVEATRRLKTSYIQRKIHFSLFATAIHDNRKMWRIFATDVSSKENGLPPDLKAKIFYLNEFVQSYSTEVLRDEVDISPLIDINLAVLRGLQLKGGSE